MGFINSNNEYGIISYSFDNTRTGKYCALGLYDSDTDLVEVFILPENKRVIMNIDQITIITCPVVKRSVKLLYDKTSK